MTLEQYLINVGIRSKEFAYTDKVILDNVAYFKRCYKWELSSYKALLFFNGYLN